MDIVLNQGYPDRVGRRYIFCGNAVGPTLYVTGGVALNIGQYNNYIDVVFPALSVSGTYELRGIASGAGPRATWKAKIFVVSTGAEAAAIDLSAQTFIVGGFAGVY